MSSLDLSKLSYTELKSLSRQLEEQIAAKRDEELKVLVDGFAKKLEAAGFSVGEGVEALKPYLGASARSPRGQGAQSGTVLYRDPAHPQNAWSGRGRAPGWLVDYEAQGRERVEFKV